MLPFTFCHTRRRNKAKVSNHEVSICVRIPCESIFLVQDCSKDYFLSTLYVVKEDILNVFISGRFKTSV